MVAKELTQDLIEDGARLVRQLDEMGHEPQAAFWMLVPEVETWRLAIYEPDLANAGPQKGYRAIQRSLDRLDPPAQQLSLDNVVVLQPSTRLVDLLRVARRTGPGVSRIRLTSKAVDGELIPDAFLYRVT